ncbi:MAG: hypothetical protein EXQ91_03780 [Alphaproteobacteria bacterium]|nr:hypothetical protein [Alphaproteobacteria bacterium]
MPVEHKVLSTIHSAFAVSDIERTTRLFTEFLGFKLVARDVGQPELVETLTGVKSEVKLAFVKSPDGHMIELVEWINDKKPVQGKVNDVGWWHIALEVDSLEKAMKHAKTYGLGIYNKVVEREGGTRRTAYFRDPDGITIELSQRPRSRG